MLSFFLRHFSSLLEKRRFRRQWKTRNNHNRVIPMQVFPLHLVSVGSHSYGELQVLAYDLKQTRNKLKIGNFVSISTDVRFILDGNHQSDKFTTFPLKSFIYGEVHQDDSLSKGSIVIEDEVWIGNRATILSGVRVGKGAVIAAGALVNRDVRPYSIVGGVPARHLRFRIREEYIEKFSELNLVELPIETIESNLELFYRDIDPLTIAAIEALFEEKRNEKSAHKIH